nr:hypothetical protein [Tanacetum cinerariifolium]
QFAALFVIRLEEGAELALSEHDRPGELLEIQAQTGFEHGFVFGFVLRAEDLFAVQIGQGLTAGLKFFRGVIPRAVGFPTSAVAAFINAD